MNYYITNDYQALSELTSSLVLSKMLVDHRVNLSLTGGSTPKGAYAILKDQLKAYGPFPHVHFYPFDETIVLNQANEVVNYENVADLKAQLFTPGGIADDHIHHMTETYHDTFAADIARDGGLDLMLIGIGSDGHFNANMPETVRYDEYVYGVALTDDYPWNAPYQATLGDDRHAEMMYTLGFKSLLKVRHVICIVNGSHKAEAVKKMIEGEVDPTFPASYLRFHPNLTVILDRDAASLLDQ